MYDFRDPTVLHAADCARCHASFRDGDILNEDGHCPDCVDDLEAEAEEEARMEAEGADQ